LFSVGFAVRLQNSVNEWDRHGQLRPLALRDFPLARYRAGQGFPDHPPVYPQLLGHPFDRSGAMLILAPDLLV
jgi:hypothetical protein